MLLDFLIEINEFDHSIKFTHELENNGTLFLDILLIKDNNTVKHKVYWKTVKIDCVISFRTTIASNYKMFSFNSVINITFMCSEVYIEEELAKDHGPP